jgi:hypothetical protein
MAWVYRLEFEHRLLSLKTVGIMEKLEYLVKICVTKLLCVLHI